MDTIPLFYEQIIRSLPCRFHKEELARLRTINECMSDWRHCYSWCCRSDSWLWALIFRTCKISYQRICHDRNYKRSGDNQVRKLCFNSNILVSWFFVTVD